uniref:SMP-30/Gluconolactonase/LRE-like region domain-containing protein n=1 Tax=Oryza barthii TaxID=65489 RepID=A0A0D3FHK9_9ORYZ
MARASTASTAAAAREAHPQRRWHPQPPVCRCPSLALASSLLLGSSLVNRQLGGAWPHAPTGPCSDLTGDGFHPTISVGPGSRGGGALLRAEAKGKEKEEERVVLADPDVAGRVALGLTVDAPRGRLLIVYADRLPRFAYSAVAAYDLASWRRLFLTRLDGPGDSTLADDVAVDEEGNAYVTDAKGNKIWKVSPDGEPLSVIKNATFFQRPGWINNFVGLNGIVYHPNGYLLVIHTSGGDLFKVCPKTGSVHVVKVKGSLKTGDGLALLSPTRLVAAGLVSRLVESDDDWETAVVTGRYVGPAHRIGSSATVKDGDVYINHIIGFGLGKKTHVISKAAFAPL